MTIPNYITILRLLLVPFVVWAMLSGHQFTAFLGFMTAGVSDGVDGYIARRYDMKSELGAYLDPVADKLLLVSVFIVLAYQEMLRGLELKRDMETALCANKAAAARPA